MASAPTAAFPANDFPAMFNLSIRVTQDQSAALLALKDGGARLLRPLATAWGSGAQEVLGRAIKGRFTGQGPFPVSQNRLGIVTNRLRKSMRATAPQVDASTGTVTVSMGSNVRYYAGHEFGFRGRQQVKGHTRKTIADNSRTPRGKLTKGAINKEKNRIQITGRGRYSYVKPHTRRVNIPARRPLGTELDSIQTRLTFRKKIQAVLRRYLIPKP